MPEVGDGRPAGCKPAALAHPQSDSGLWLAFPLLPVRDCAPASPKGGCLVRLQAEAPLFPAMPAPAPDPAPALKTIFIPNGPLASPVPLATPPERGHPDWPRLSISSDHIFVFLSILTTFAPELSEFNGQN